MNETEETKATFNLSDHSSDVSRIGWEYQCIILLSDSTEGFYVLLRDCKRRSIVSILKEKGGNSGE